MNPTVLEFKSELSDSSTSLQQSESTDLSVQFASVDDKPDSDSSISDIFRDNGYTAIKKISDTLQGELYKASIINHNPKNKNKSNYVAIKRTSKYLHNNHIAIEYDIDDGSKTTFCISENIVKEAIILKYLTRDNETIGDYIVNFVDFFQTEKDFFLVTEYVAPGMNLKQFVSESRQYIKNGQLNIQEYRKVIKYLFWQLFVTIQFLHESMHCVHLDLNKENVLLQNAVFIKESNKVRISPEISVKLCDFGVSEIFESKTQESNPFMCNKNHLTLEYEYCAAPEVFTSQLYDARLSDTYSLGIMLFECMTLGKRLYEPLSMHDLSSGFNALHNHQLKKYLLLNDLLKYFPRSLFSLVNGLLNVDASKRFNGMAVLKHKWYKSYYKKYQKRVHKQLTVQKQKINTQKCLPYYLL